MPFDAATYSPTIRDALTLDGFRSWLEGLPPDAALGHFMDIKNCAIALYLTARGFSDFSVGGSHVWLGRVFEVFDFPQDLYAAQGRAQEQNLDWLAGRREITAGQYLAAVNSK